VEGTTGLLVPPGDARALAAAIDTLLADPRRAAIMGDAGRRRVRERFSAAGQAEQLAALFGTETRGAPDGTEPVEAVGAGAR
jgi:starch synthase